MPNLRGRRRRLNLRGPETNDESDPSNAVCCMEIDHAEHSRNGMEAMDIADVDRSGGRLDNVGDKQRLNSGSDTTSCGLAIDMNSIDGDNDAEAAKEFKFSSICRYLDRFWSAKKEKPIVRKRIFDSLVQKYSSLNKQANVFPLIRLIIGTRDDRRFFIKSRRLILTTCKHFLLPENVKKNLFQIQSKSTIMAIKHLATEIAERTAPQTSDFSIYDVNILLDQFYLNQIDIAAVLKPFSIPQQLFWILNIIIRNVENVIKLDSSTLLKWTNPLSIRMIQSGVKLKDICSKKNDAVHTLLFSMFEPMLLAKLPSNVDIYNTLTEYCGMVFSAEWKYDGEHFLIHRNESKEYRYYSRHQNNFTDSISPTLDKRIDEFFAPSLKNCVLDVELILYDKCTKKYVGKGDKASDGRVYDVKYVKDGDGVSICVVVIDVLYLNDQSLLDAKFEDRIKYLYDNSILARMDERIIFISNFMKISSRQEFIQFYENAVKEECEGIVCKRYDSLYKIGERILSNGWFKIKPFHVSGETLDVAIVGVDRRKNGYIDNYSIAVNKDGQFYVIGKVKMGLSRSTRRFIDMKLTKSNGLITNKYVPNWIDKDSLNDNLPRHFIKKENIQIVEVKANGTMNGKLSFPSMIFHRYDKLFNEMDTYWDFISYEQKLRETSIECMKSRDIREEKEESASGDDAKCSSSETANAPKRISLKLENIEFCIIKCEPQADSIKNFIELHGGKCVANPGSATKLILTSQPTIIRIKSIIRSNKYTVLNSNWITECIKASKILPPNDSHMIYRVDDDTLSNLYR